MIKTKTAKLVDAQQDISTLVYFDITVEQKNYGNNTVSFRIVSYVPVTDNETGEVSLSGTRENVATFSMDKYKELFGSKTINTYEGEKDNRCKATIDWCNKREWDGSEPMEKIVFWDLVKTDLEIVV